MGTQEGVALWIRPGSGVDAVTIVRGLTGRHKAITVEGMAAAGVRAVLLGTAPPPASERQGSESPFQHLPPYPPRSSGPPPPVPGSWSGSASLPPSPAHSLRARSQPGLPRVWYPCRPPAGACRGEPRRGFPVHPPRGCPTSPPTSASPRTPPLSGWQGDCGGEAES